MNATVLDIGGWIGITGLFYSTLAPRVIALEPDMAARSELVANVALNPLLEPRIRIYDKCISDKREKVLMKGDPGGSWSSTKFFDDKKLPAWEVDCMPLEDFLKIANVEVKDIILCVKPCAVSSRLSRNRAYDRSIHSHHPTAFLPAASRSTLRGQRRTCCPPCASG